MTDELTTEVTPAGRSQRSNLAGYGKAPVLAGGVVALLLFPALVMGGLGVANALTSNSPASATSTALHTEAPPTPDPGGEAPGADDPVTPPDRDSDQTEVEPQEDKVYYIQDGDTLTTLSARFGVSVDYLANYNAVRDVDVISEGAVLRMPFIYEPPASSEPGTTPLGDTLD